MSETVKTYVRTSGECEGKILPGRSFAPVMSAYARQSLPGATGTMAMAFRVSTMHWAQSPSS